MINLIEAQLSSAQIASILRGIKRNPLLPSMDAPEWKRTGKKSAVEKWMKAILALAEMEAFEPLPPLPNELYALFYKTGKRTPFEMVYMERRRRLARVAMVVLTGDAQIRERFVPALVEKIGAVMEEESWTFPAHAWTKPTGKDPFQIDLFAAETANLMGELHNVFGTIIPESLKERIHSRLREQIFQNYLHPRSEFSWKHLPMNWNAVCHQGVIGAALAVEEDSDLVAQLLSSGAECLKYFLSGFGSDGSTSEGPGYWSYGFGRYAELNRQIETATGGALSIFGNSERIRRIAQFAPAMVLSNRHMVNFSDCERVGSLPAELLSYLGERLEITEMSQESAALFRHAFEQGIPLDAERCDFYQLARLFLRCPHTLSDAVEPKRADAFFRDYGAVVARSHDTRGNLLEFAAKAGHNAEHHNHNDCGSFILNLNGEDGIIEIGAPEYVGPYFSSDETRYAFLAARSLGHSVPLVNGREQSPGTQYAASVLECDLQENRVKFVVDLTKCYPAEAQCRELIRTFVFEKEDGVLQVKDSYELEEPGIVQSVIITAGAVSCNDGIARLSGAGGILEITAGGGLAFQEAEVCKYSARSGEVQEIRRLRLHPQWPARRGVIEYQVRPARNLWL